MVKEKLTEILVRSVVELGNDKANVMFAYIGETKPKKQYYTHKGAVLYFERESNSWIKLRKEVIEAKVVYDKYGYFVLNGG